MAILLIYGLSLYNPGKEKTDKKALQPSGKVYKDYNYTVMIKVVTFHKYVPNAYITNFGH